MTPYESREWCQASFERESSAWKRHIWAAWHGALYARMKKLPKISDVLKSVGSIKSAKVEKQPADIILSKLMVLHKAFKGIDKRKVKT